MCTLRNSQIGRLNFLFENWTYVFEPFPRKEDSKQISHSVRGTFGKLEDPSIVPCPLIFVSSVDLPS